MNTKELYPVVDRIIELGHDAVQFAHIERATIYESGRRENDAEHSHMLAFIAPYLAKTYYSEMDIGLISLFTTIHDDPELLCGDISTLGMSDTQYQQKQLAERSAVEKRIALLPEPWSELLDRYELQKEPEARFVKLVDKLMPALMKLHGDGLANFENCGIFSRKEFEDDALTTSARLCRSFPEFPELHEIRQQLLMVVGDTVYGQ